MCGSLFRLVAAMEPITLKLFQHVLPNGLVVLAEAMDWLQSAAFSISLPAGCVHDPADRLGLANFTAEMVQRGAGDLNSRQFAETLDRLGVDRNAIVTSAHTGFSAATIADNLLPALGVYADLVRRPHIPAPQMEDARQVCFLELYSLQDDLAQRTMQDLKLLTYGQPWGRSSVGHEAAVEAISHEDVSAFHAANYNPQGAILSVAGRFDWDELRHGIEQMFGGWENGDQASLEATQPEDDHAHIEHESSQTQIGLAYPAVPYKHDDYFLSRGAVGVLSDGMSSRLFTEVRENRGLCYTVYATYHSLIEEGRVLCYAGTSTDRAQETLDVIVSELHRLSQGIDDSELRRLKARTKSALIMQQESSSSRAVSIAGDWYYLGRVRPLEEVNSEIDALTKQRINDFLAANPPSDFNVVTLGAQPLEMPHGVC